MSSLIRTGCTSCKTKTLVESARRRETKSSLDPGLRSPCDKELDPGYLFDEPSQDGEDRRRRSLVLALVESVNHYDR